MSHILLERRAYMWKWKYTWKWDKESSRNNTSMSILASNFYWVQRNTCLLSYEYQLVFSDISKNLTNVTCVHIFRGVNPCQWIHIGCTDIRLIHNRWEKLSSKAGNKKQNPLPWITFPHVSWRPLTFPSGQLHWLDLLVYLFN